MKSRGVPVFVRFIPLSSLVLLSLFSVLAVADNQTPSAPATLPRMSKETRMDLIRAFSSELVYIRSPFPMGRKGLMLKDGIISPNGPQLQEMIAMWGPAAKPGDQARISDIIIKDDRIRFEINGGPVKKQKWYQHISISAGGADTPVAPSDANANPRGSFLDLVFDQYVPELDPKQLKGLLRPVFDFDAKSATEAYLETVPPKVKQAIKDHTVLVGMNREMVIYAKGRPPKKVREKDGETEYEEWIYGDPPKDVEFVRMVGDEVIRVEVMKVNGEKIYRTEKEVDLDQPTVASSAQKEVRPANAPTLRRPGEEPSAESSQRPVGPGKAAPIPPAPPPQQPQPPHLYAEGAGSGF